jgi:hypothetical protein
MAYRQCYVNYYVNSVLSEDSMKNLTARVKKALLELTRISTSNATYSLALEWTD